MARRILAGVPLEVDPQRRSPLRRDAERNRQRILDTAKRLIGERGLDISHDELAREAGVGVGTVYRRFPTAADLFDAVYYQELDDMVATAEEAAALEDPWEALEAFFVRTFEAQAANRGLRELLIGHRGGTELARRAQARIGPIVEGMVARAHEAGRLHPAIVAEDMAVVPMLINAVIRGSAGVAPDLWRRWLAIVLEGMAAGPRPRTFPGSPPDRHDVPRLIGRKARNRGARRRQTDT